VFVPVGLLNGFSVILIYAALMRGSVAVVAPLLACYPLATLVWSRLILGAGGVGWRAVLGVGITVAGVALLLRG
jgi:drug/metabolite transporter (DMT)-like permease